MYVRTEEDSIVTRTNSERTQVQFNFPHAYLESRKTLGYVVPVT